MIKRDKYKDVSVESGDIKETENIKMLVEAIDKFEKMYEHTNLFQMIELEKQRQFGENLEVHRMQLLMDTRVQLEKVKHTKRSSSGSNGKISRCVFMKKFHLVHMHHICPRCLQSSKSIFCT